MDYRHFFEYEVGIQKIKYRGSQGTGCCPLHDDRNPSFWFNNDTGQWTCFSNCGTGNAYTLAKSLNMDNPRQYIESSTIDSKNYTTNEYEPINTLKSEDKDVFQVDKIERLEQLKEKYGKNHFGDEIMVLGKDRFVGKDDDGKAVFFYENAIKYHKCKPYWHPESLEKGCQIFMVDLIDESQDTLYICEGEKDTYAFPSWLNAVCFSAGAGSIPKNLSPLYYDNLKNIVIPYDKDKAGKRGMENLAKRIKSERPDLIVRMIKWDDDLPDGFDITDAIEKGTDFFNSVLDKTEEYHQELPKQIKGFKIMTGIEASNTTPKPTEWIVEGVLPKQFNTCIAGTTGSKKSMWAIQLALSVANGEKYFCSNPIKTSGMKVLYIDTEIGQDELHRRYRKIKNHMDWQGDENWLMMSKGGITMDIWEQAEEMIAIYRPELVVIDSMYNATSVSDFSKATGMSKVTDALSIIKDKYGVTILLVAHFNKGGHDQGLSIDRMQGSAVFQNWIEFQILMIQTNIQDFNLFQVAKTRGVRHDKTFIGLKWDDFWFTAKGVIDDISPYLVTEHKKRKWTTILEDLPEQFDTNSWLNVFNSGFELSERTGKTWLKEASGTPMVKKIAHGLYKKNLELIDENDIEN